MRRRSVNTRYVIFGSFLLFVGLALTTSVLMPVERLMLDGAASLLFGIESLTSPVPAVEGDDGIRVVGKRSDEFRDILILNKSILVGTPIVSDGVLVGLVTSESRSSSRVQVVSSPAYKINGVFGRSGIPIELEGRGAGILEARVPRGSDVVRGDVIYYDEEQRLIIGAVARVEDVASNPFITLIITHPVNVTTLTEVSL